LIYIPKLLREQGRGKLVFTTHRKLFCRKSNFTELDEQEAGKIDELKVRICLFSKSANLFIFFKAKSKNLFLL